MFCIEIKILIGILLPVLIDFKHWLEVNLMYQADVLAHIPKTTLNGVIR